MSFTSTAMHSSHSRDPDQGFDELVVKLTTGFRAMLDQVTLLASKNTELEQQLAFARGEARYLTRSNGQLVGIDSQDEKTELQRRRSYSEPGDEGNVMGPEEQESAMAIADGVKAWKILTDKTGPLVYRHGARSSDQRQSQDFAQDFPKQDARSTGKSDVDQNISKRPECPFASMSHLGERATADGDESAKKRPESLPTPPHTQQHFHEALRKDSFDSHDSPPPSVSGSISKCPIRMLGERSPEEIAQFFETHKHEIPRSHEICVRRYQSDSQTIRELDAKYGNLANMIKGLGMKHQPLLPGREEDDEDGSAMDTRSIRKVQSWAHKVDVVHDGVDKSTDIKTNNSEMDDRQGHFDRPFREIRVGESPSRPWGISVPVAEPPVTLRENGSTPRPKGTQTKARDARSGNRTRVATGDKMDEPGNDKPRMLFTGPVFIGYGPEQAAALIRECDFENSRG